MDNIISQTLTVDVVCEPTSEIEEVFSSEVRKADNKPKVTRLTSVGYDEEIGLWEEQQHRANRNKFDTD